MIFCEKEDSLLRGLSYFKEFKDLLKDKLFKDHFDDFTFLSLFDDLLFRVGGLKKQLQQSPWTAQAIGEVLTEILDYHKSQGNFQVYCQLVWISLRLKSYCEYYAPAYSQLFPHFREELKSLAAAQQDPVIKQQMIFLQTLMLGETTSSLEERQEAVSILCNAFLTLTPKNYANSNEKFIFDLFQAFRMKYWEWRPAMIDLLQDQQQRNDILNQVLEANGVVFSGNSSWTISALGCYKRDEFEMNLFQAKLSLADKSSQPLDLLRTIQNQTRHLSSQADQLRFISHRTLETPNKELHVELEQDSIQVKKVIENKTYRPVSHLIQNAKWLETLQYTSQPEDLCWLEETENLRKEARLYRQGILLKRFIVTEEPKNKTYQLSGVYVDHTLVQPVDLDKIRHLLAPLNRFCELSKIKTWMEPGQSHLHWIDFQPYGLSFTLTNHQGEWRATHDALFPGYHIAPQQNHPALAGFASYLLLENHQGRKKVIIPKGQLITSVAWQFLSKLGPLAHFMNSWLNPLKDSEQPGYYVYELDSTGQLLSKEPEGLAYLIDLYLLQNNINQAEQASLSLETICRQIPVSLTKLLLPLALIPSSTTAISRMRRRLFAVLEENRLLLLPSKKAQITEKNAEEHFPLEDLLFMMAIMSDLKNAPSQSTEEQAYQEWFLFQRLFYHLQHMLACKLSPKILQGIETVGWDQAIEFLGLPADLSQRYQTLQKKFGQQGSWINRAAHFIQQVNHIPSGIPHLSGPLPGSDLPKNIASTLRLAISNQFLDLKILNLPELKKQMIWERHPAPPLSFDQMTPQIFKHYYLSYYAIARGEGSEEQKQQLFHLLPLIKGGWDSQTQILTHYLEVISCYPFLFDRAEKFEKAFYPKSKDKVLDEVFEKKFPLWIPFFQKLNQRILACQTTENGLGIAAQMAFNTVSQAFMRSLTGSLLPGVALSALNMGSKIYQAYKGTPQALTLSEKRENPEPSYAYLKEEDQKIDKIFDALFDLTFEEISPSENEKRLKPFKSQSEDATISDRFARVNRSLHDYYTRKDPQRPFLKLKGFDTFRELYLRLTAYQTEWMQNLEQERLALLALANRKESPLTLDDLKNYFLKGHLHAISQELQFTPQDSERLEQAVAYYLLRSTRLHQLQRALRHLEELAQMDSQNSEEKIEQLADELKTRRVYCYQKLPARLSRHFLAFEFVSHHMLWKKQAQCLEEVLLGDHGDVVAELLMSFGKTYFGIPTIDAFEADGKKIIFNIWPSPVAETNTHQISQQSKKIFDQTANTLHFNRSMPLDLKNLDAIWVLLQRALNLGETINMTKEDAQSLELLFIGQLYRQLTHKKSHEILLRLKVILQTIRTVGKAVGDEAHELFDDRKELSYPVGPSSTIPPSFYQVMETCLHLAAKNPLFQQFLQADTSIKSPEEFAQIALSLADQMSGRFGLTTEEKRQEFIAFVSNKDSTPWMEEHELYSEIVLIKGLLTTFLPLAVCGRAVDVNYGPSLVNQTTEYALPYEGNTSPLENASIRNPFEALVKTFIMFLSKGLNAEQVRKLVIQLKEKALQEMKVRQISIRDTQAFQLFNRLAPQYNLLQTHFTSQEWKDIQERLSHQTEAILLYVRYFVWHQIRYWKLNIQSNPQNFSSIFGSQFYDTGTPYNDGTYPNVKMLWDPGTTGEALDIISKKCSAIHILKNQKPENILEEVLTSFFHPHSQFSALIDGGAQLKGLTNEQVARKILKHAQQHLPHIQAVDYFTRGPDGRDQLVTLEKGAHHPIPYEACSSKARLAYFDQRHGFAANIPQKFNGKGLLLIGKGHTLSRFLQEAFRMRGIKQFKRLLSNQNSTEEQLEKKNLEETQTIEIAMTKEVQQLISSVPTLKQIIRYLIDNEGQETIQRNEHAYFQKVDNVIRRAVLDKILATHSADQMLKIFEEFEHVFVSKVEDDPKEWMKSKRNPKTAKEKALAIIQDSHLFDEKEKSEIRDKLNTIPLGFEKRQQATTPFDGLELNQNLEVDQDQDLNLDNELDVQHYSLSNSPVFEEWEWSKNINPTSLDWLVFTPVQKTSSFWSEKLEKMARMIKKASLPPLFRARDVLAYAKNPVLPQIASAIDERIWFSNNFLPLVVRRFSEEPVEVGSDQQRELYQVLIHIEKEENGCLKIRSVGCLSQHEAAVWRDKLTSSENKQMKVILYDTKLRTIAAGSRLNLHALKKNQDFLKLEMQLRYLNADTAYHKDLSSPFKKWATKHGIKNIKKAFYSMHGQRGKSALPGTDIDCLFKELHQEPIEL